MASQIIKRTLPPSVFTFLKSKKNIVDSYRNLILAYKYDLNRYFKHSASKGFNSETKLIGKIIKDYHVVEKGLTMPEPRMGFGKLLVMSLINDCITFILKHGNEEEQLVHAIGVVFEYEEFHHRYKYKLDDDILSRIKDLRAKAGKLNNCEQRVLNKDEYFSRSGNSFLEFSESRSSVRNYTTEEIPLELMHKVINLARNTPSACNRQTARVQLYTDKDEINRILEAQGGNRGFGHLANKLIVITAELGVFSRPLERNQAFIDGGMYAMNLLYALHYYKIGACILNCSTSPEKDLRLRSLCYDTKDSEVFIAMISCGIPPSEFSVPASRRYAIDQISNIITPSSFTK